MYYVVNVNTLSPVSNALPLDEALERCDALAFANPWFSFDLITADQISKLED